MILSIIIILQIYKYMDIIVINVSIYNFAGFDYLTFSMTRALFLRKDAIYVYIRGDKL